MVQFFCHITAAAEKHLGGIPSLLWHRLAASAAARWRRGAPPAGWCAVSAVRIPCTEYGVLTVLTRVIIRYLVAPFSAGTEGVPPGSLGINYRVGGLSPRIPLRIPPTADHSTHVRRLRFNTD